MRLSRISIAVLALACLAAPALGAGPPPPDPAANGGDWAVSAGAGVVVSPEYPGSKSVKALPVPWWSVVYRNRFFSRGPEFAGVYLVNDGAWSAGGSLQYDFGGRDAEDDPRLAGTDDVRGTVRAKLFATRKLSLLSLSASASQDVGGQRQGMLVKVDAPVAIPFFRPWFFSVGPGVAWGDRRYAATFFGVTAAESARSGLPRHDAGAGLVDFHLSLVARRPISERLGASAQVTLARLVGDAADSPIAETRNQATGIFSIAWRFSGPAR